MYVHATRTEEKQTINKGIKKTVQVEVEDKCDGFKLYQYGEDGELKINSLGYEFENIGELIEGTRQIPEGGICDEVV